MGWFGALAAGVRILTGMQAAASFRTSFTLNLLAASRIAVKVQRVSLEKQV